MAASNFASKIATKLSFQVFYSCLCYAELTFRSDYLLFIATIYTRIGLNDIKKEGVYVWTILKKRASVT